MKDHVKQSDLLTSLRRLMSDDAGMQRRPGKDKLLLTEAQRVEHVFEYDTRAETRPAAEVERMARKLLQRPAMDASAKSKVKPNPNLRAELKAALGSRVDPGDDPQSVTSTGQEKNQFESRAEVQNGFIAQNTLEEKVARIAEMLTNQAEGDDDGLVDRVGSNVIRLVHSAEKPVGHSVTEDDLREIVADLVRSELKGKLGEQISQTIRDFVRCEIHRSLAEHTQL